MSTWVVPDCEIPGTCDWGDCDDLTVALREHEEHGWLAVCLHHATESGAICRELPYEDES